MTRIVTRSRIIWDERWCGARGELAPVPGVVRAESVPDLTRRFEALLSNDSRVRIRLSSLDGELNASLSVK